jgi:hypothetical protein
MNVQPSRRWPELTAGEQSALVALGIAELVTTAVAVVDLVRRPRERVRGPKALWFAASAVQPFGPVAYLLFGRRRGIAQASISPGNSA